MIREKGGGPLSTILTAEIYLICVALSVLVLIWIWKSAYASIQEIWMTRTILSLLVNNSANFLFVVVCSIQPLDQGGIALAYGVKTVYFLSLAALVICWYIYADIILRSGYAYTGKRILQPAISFGVACIIPIVNLFYPWMFSVDQTGTYRQYYMFFVESLYLFAVSGIKAFMLFKEFREERNKDRRELLLVIGVFPLLLVAPSVVGILLGGGVPVQCVLITIQMLGLYEINTRQQISVDTLTQVNNRMRLMQYLEDKLENHFENLYLLLLDLDRFKEINDTYGHVEGDEALRQLSSALKHACSTVQPRPFIARYGGDEFVVIVEGAKFSADTVCEKIEEQLKAVNAKNSRYAINVSIGQAKWHHPMSPQDFIDAADTEMYKVKMARKAKAKKDGTRL